MTMSFPALQQELTKTEHRIAEFISSNTEAFLFMGIAQLSEALQVSEGHRVPVCPTCGLQRF